MSKSKKDNKKGGKDKKEVPKPASEEVEVTPVIVTPEVIPDIHSINIVLEGFRQINRSFPISDLTVKAKYLGNELGESPKVPVTDDEVISVTHQFTLECDLNSPTQIDNLISNPVEFIIIENYGSFDLSAYSNVTEQSLPQAHYQGFSVESEEDLFKSFIEVKEEQEAAVTVADKEKQKAAKDDKKKKPTAAPLPKSPKKGSASKSSKKKESPSRNKTVGTTTETEKTEDTFVDTTPRTLGTCTLDFISLFLGQDDVVQTIPIVPSYRVFDENMIVWKELPKLVVRMTVADKWAVFETKLANILSLTVESMYNIPSIMTPEMEYSVCTLLPSTSSMMEPIVLGNATYKTTKDTDQVKFWPGLPKTDDLRSASNYRIDPNMEDIRNYTDVNLKEILTQDVPRIEWNYLRRRFITEDGCCSLYSFLKKHRHIILEIFMRTKEAAKDAQEVETVESARTSKGKGSDKQSSTKSSSGKGKNKSMKSSADRGEYLHLMAIVDVSALLYPGVNKLHVACPLTTFHEEEAKEAAALKTSFFMPKPVEIIQEEAPKKEKKGRPKSADSKSSKGSSKKSKKGGKAKSEQSEKKNLQEVAEISLPPPPPPPPEPSVIVYNENGLRTFIIIEIELLRPITKKREIEDINSQLQNLFPDKPPLPKEIITSRLAGEMYRETIRKLTEDLNYHYTEYLKDVEKCECGGDSGAIQSDFLTYLNRIGVYPTYLSSLTKAAAVVVKDKFAYNGNCDVTNTNYQTFIAEVFSYLIEEMNIVINEIVTYGLESKPVGSIAALDALLLYAKEACELNADALAERYHLERVARNEKVADRWFDYAVFLMEIKEEDKAYECVRKALIIDIKHRYCLIMAGLLLANKNQYAEAETCFLSLTSEYPFWTEGWGAFLVFYRHIYSYEGEQACLSMIQKSTGEAYSVKDYFMNTDELGWTTSICPDDAFTRTAILLIKLRCFHYAEIALAYNIPTKKSGIVDYLAAVICYYRKEYQTALNHLKQAENLHGLDYGTASLKGHCLLALGFGRQALVAYLHVLHSYNRPDDIHMVYVKAAVIFESFKDLQEARKLMLLVCKYSPTPYTWLTAGLLYYKQNDLLSAEACLMEANTCDRKLPETWAYLTLVNVQLERLTEAEFCQREALKTNLSDQEMINRLEDAIRSFRKREERKRSN